MQIMTTENESAINLASSTIKYELNLVLDCDQFACLIGKLIGA